MQISARKKLKVGFCLCVGTVNILFAAIKLNGLRMGTAEGGLTTDNIWGMFWLHTEACVAVTVVSVTAFRSLFVSIGDKKYRTPAEEERIGRRGLLGDRKYHGFGGFESQTKSRNLPSIPSATLRGMRTLIRACPKSSVMRSQIEGPEADNRQTLLVGQPIRITYEFSSEPDHVSGSPILDA